MKVKLILILSLIVTNSYSKANNWYERSSVKVKDQKYIWFLGVAESKNLNEAQSESDLNAKKNLIEHFSINKVFNKSNLSERNNSSESKDELYTVSDILPVPIAETKIKRMKQSDSSGKWLVYTDIAVKLTDLPKIEKNKKSPTFEQALNEYERDDSDFREHYNKEDSFLGNNHTIYWIPIMTDGLALTSFAYEYSFLKRKFSFEYFGMARDPVADNESNSSTTFEAGQQKEDIQKTYIDFNYSFSRSYNEQIIFFGGYLHHTVNKAYKYTSNGETTNEYKDVKGFSTGFKYRKTWKNSDGGYLVNLRHENLSGENFDKSEIDNDNQAVLQLGLFYSF